MGRRQASGSPRRSTRLCDAIAGRSARRAALRDAAVRAHAEAMVEMWLRTEGLDAARADPGCGRCWRTRGSRPPSARVERRPAEAFAPWLRTGPDRLTELIGTRRPPAAAGRGRPTDRWLGPAARPTAPVRSPVPELWRIGTGASSAGPVRGSRSAVPLLDESHLQISHLPGRPRGGRGAGARSCCCGC